MIPLAIFLFFLVQSSFADFEDSYAERGFNSAYADDLREAEDGDLDKRDNHFMRFGRNDGDYKAKEYSYEEYDDADADAEVKRSGNHHVRFGRSGSNAFMRFGRSQDRGRNKSMFMRIGRNFQEQDGKIRSKRSAPPSPADPDYPKRKDHFMRFGKSPSFMRYGRNPDLGMGFNRPFDHGKIEPFPDHLSQVNGWDPKENQMLSLLLAKLLARRQEAASENSL
ncbi:unnamed protein product [Phyllotreta striolata]|uniref:Uncharacterized protein n=1 Tax=Phyllotreta striolata TaxID=444603 RepID=A0A9N9XSC4_PHYSR|nr:unnamed protein product [Phyllotreta striolata]